VWADLVTDKVPAAQKFYADLFGWRFRIIGNYIIAVNQDRPIAGMFQVERPKDRPDAKPRWFGYVSVPNVDRAQRVVSKAGGRVLAPPKKMANRGEQAVFTDPEGAVFGVIKSSSGDPEDLLPEPGDWVWVQLLSRDGRKAAEFYREVAGYEVVENTVTNNLSDYVLVSKGYARATVRTLPASPPTSGPIRAAWLPFVRVKSVPDCVAQVAQLGGKVLLAPSPQLLQGKLAIVADPTGAEIGVMEWSSELLKGGH
jgi:predicted enzyme related to lactoylglutathione lyase